MCFLDVFFWMANQWRVPSFVESTQQGGFLSELRVVGLLYELFRDF